MSAPPDSPIKYTRGPGAAPKRSRADVPLPEGVVVVEPSALDPGQRAVAARLAGVSIDTVNTHANAGLPLIVAEAKSASLAQARAVELSPHLPGLVAVNPAAAMPAWLLPAVAATGALGFILGVVALALTGPMVAILVVALAAVGGIAEVGFGFYAGLAAQARYKEAIELQREAGGAGGVAEAAPLTAALAERLGAARAQVGQADIAELAVADLQETLSALSAELPALSAKEARGEDIGETLAALNAALSSLEGSLGADEREDRLSEVAARLRTQARAVERSAVELGDDEAKRRAAQRLQQLSQQKGPKGL